MTDQANLSIKRKPSEQVDRPPKKPKVVTGLTVSETPATSKLPLKHGSRKGKGLMKGADPITKKRLVLLHEDSGYVLNQLSYIIKDDNYDDLGNHAIEAIGRRAYSVWYKYVYSSPFLCSFLLLSHSNTFFWFLQGVVMMKRLIDHCASHKMVITSLREKVEATDSELRELTA